jgi:hypothetical protein
VPGRSGEVQRLVRTELCGDGGEDAFPGHVHS